jgi:flagellar biogenesis protein FliO
MAMITQFSIFAILYFFFIIVYCVEKDGNVRTHTAKATQRYKFKNISSTSLFARSQHLAEQFSALRHANFLCFPLLVG